MREADVQKWTDQETLLLLEGVELYHEDWTRISLHVGKPRDECLLTFLQLPIEDTFVPKEDLSLNNPNNIKTCNATENPILALTAFLASVVTPNVAKKAGIYFY
jgi:SWI/SNF related-matrix-associated actin-dependent regulator of chromatin subfamily C